MVMGRNGYGPKWSWAEMVMGRNDPESRQHVRTVQRLHHERQLNGCRARFARAYSRQSPNRTNPVLDASPQSPADLSTGRLATTLLPSLFLRSGVCGEIVNELARICTSSLLIFQKICSLTIFISFSPSPMLGRMELRVPSNLPFSSPLCWENV